MNTLHRDEQAPTLALNKIGRLNLRVTAPLFTDPYRTNRTNRTTGSFILVDEGSNVTVAAGMVLCLTAGSPLASC